ncbi:MAG: ribonuclease HIII, partial [Verrucomicrobia bacterium]|nr:ribonuclease HIII [Verrucomicrobiota bacterium]
AQIDLSLKDKLIADLETQGFTLTEAPYAFFSAKKSGLSCNLYHSGKLTVQGKGKDEFISFYLEPEILGNLSYTHPASSHDPSARIGLDEAGKGDFFGPLCIAGIFVPEGNIEKLLQLGVKDSKLLKDDVIIEISRSLKKTFPHKVLRLFPETYNRLYAKFNNLNRMLGWAHATVLEELSNHTGCKKAILDQFAFPDLMNSILKRKNMEINLIQRVRGEEDPVVAAASILARAAFVEGMKELEEEVELNLPKGASASVVKAAQKALASKGLPIFDKIAKTHFKTFKDLCDAQRSSY